MTFHHSPIVHAFTLTGACNKWKWKMTIFLLYYKFYYRIYWRLLAITDDSTMKKIKMKMLSRIKPLQITNEFFCMSHLCKGLCDLTWLELTHRHRFNGIWTLHCEVNNMNPCRTHNSNLRLESMHVYVWNVPWHCDTSILTKRKMWTIDVSQSPLSSSQNINWSTNLHETKATK